MELEISLEAYTFSLISVRKNHFFPPVLGILAGNVFRRLAFMTKPRTLTQKLIDNHLVDGDVARPGEEIRLKVDQVLLQDATGTLTMLALDAMGLDRIQVETACQ